MAADVDQMSDEEFDQYMQGAIAEGDEPEVNEEVELDEVEPTEEQEVTEEVAEDENTEDEVDEESTEQPESDADAEDSDDDTENEDDEDDTEEESKEAETAIDAEQDEPTEESTEKTEKEVEVPTYNVKANGMDFQFTAEEMVDLVPKAMDYTKKMQQIAPYRKMISALEEAELGKDDVNLMIDVLKGDKEAIATVLKKTNVDTIDLPESGEIKYQPRDYGRNEVELAIDDVVETISKDQEYAVTKHVIDAQWDSKSREAFVADPNKIALLHDDVKSGVYDAVAPQAMKLKVLDGSKKSDLDYYIEAGGKYYANKQALEVTAKAEETAKVEMEAKAKAAEAVKAKQDKQKAIKSAAGKRKAAATTKVGGAKKQITDYLANDSLSDEEWGKLMEKQIRKG